MPITKKDVFQEIISPKELERQEEPKIFLAIYKAVYMCIRLLLDVRNNQIAISEGRTIKPKRKERIAEVANAVIKNNIVIK